MEVFRSLLFAPADKPSVGAKLARAGADAVVLDLEDAISPSAKAQVRVDAHHAVDALAGSGAAVFVRVNPPASPWFDADLAAVARRPPVGVVLPKVEDPETIARVADRLAAAGACDVPIVAGLETARGVARGADVLVPPVVACYFGAEDYIADVGGRRTATNEEVRFARSMVVMSARLAGVCAIDQAVIDFADPARFRLEAAASRDLGYSGKICIHPG